MMDFSEKMCSCCLVSTICFLRRHLRANVRVGPVLSWTWTGDSDGDSSDGDMVIVVMVTVVIVVMVTVVMVY